ncbi:hypothetical protein P2H44_18445 [Albimonas sp. CAU 1670]|uniref:Nmad2 family putative nucleotide modification protein n=1 Tax=Albimonas sp. CAU 1670 TaxID=3032599 RepID=UPI0023DC5B07|nr:hypothetical protein [Albimonas sp. CAU 1670]MDF2234545.1 hypothetical protein [Albimonas sp. CAU 1670]
MLTEAAIKSHVYMYVVDRDFGFAPNPFHGSCTLACCMYRLRSTASVGDWVFGMGGSRLKATGRCIFGMKVTQTLTFEEYWLSDEYAVKKPVRNGSRAMMMGDNIYYRPDVTASWQQANSHHSYPDGTPNESNVRKDTKTNKVLISKKFVYFGREAPVVPAEILEGMGYENRIGHRKFSRQEAAEIVNWFRDTTRGVGRLILGDPFDFRNSDARYSAEGNKIIS